MPYAALVAALLLNGCSSLQFTPIQPLIQPTQNRLVELPNVDEENAALIDKALSGLKIVDLVAPVVKDSEKSIVVSMEDKISRGDSSFNYLVEDNLIGSLVSSGYKILERDENIIVREIPEGSQQYNRSLLRPIPTPPSIVLMDTIERNGLSAVMQNEKLTLADLQAFYNKLNDDYQSMVVSQNHMETADVLISYRLLELGVDDAVSKFHSQSPASAGIFGSGSISTWQVKREALARLFVRVMDAKTGEIRAAKILENSLTSDMTIVQDKSESESDFTSRANAFIAGLSKYHYSWYEQQLPNKNGNSSSQGAPQASTPKGVSN
jgi:hypothetical protein